MIDLISIPNFIKIRQFLFLGPKKCKFGTGGYFWVVSATPSQDTNETVPFPTQPEFQILTSDGDLCTNLGYQQDWYIEATLDVGSGHADAILLGK